MFVMCRNELIRHPFWAADRSNDQDAQPTKRMQDVTLPSHATFDAHIRYKHVTVIFHTVIVNTTFVLVVVKIWGVTQSD